MSSPAPYRYLLWALSTLVTLALIYCLTLVSLNSEPEGSVSSNAIFEHHPFDIIEFNKGIVMHRTCCGDSQSGTYTKESDNRWIWTLIEKRHFKVTPDGRRLDWWVIESNTREEVETTIHKIEIHPGLFSIRLNCNSNPIYNATLRRRLFQNLPF
jgi:hypothetical protein